LKSLKTRDAENAAIDERIVLDLARAGRFGEAEQHARELLAKRPEDRAGKRLLATVLFERGNVAEGEKLLRALIDADPDDPATRRSLASELTRERRFADARAILEDVVRRSNDDPRRADARSGALVELGFIAYLEKNWAEALRILTPEAIRDGKVAPRAARILVAADRDAEDFQDGLARAKAF